MNDSPSNQNTLLQQAIAALEAQRAMLGDAVVEASLAALRAQLIQTEAAAEPPTRAERSAPRLATCLIVSLVSQDRTTHQGLKVLDYSFNLLAEIVRQFDGSVQDITGNTLIALFSGGADDPARAAYAALEMREKLHEYSVELEQKGTGSISFRAGLHNGMMTGGTPGNPLNPQTATNGQHATLETASALARAAPPGAILTSQQIQPYLTHDFAVQPAATLELEQKRIPTYQLMEALQVTQVQHRNLLPQAPFIGRSREIQTMLHQIEQFNPGSVFIISGEAGLGKTRLLAEVRQAAPILQWMVVSCEALAIKIVYGPWNALLLNLIGAKITSPKKECEKRLREWLTDHGISADYYAILANQLGLTTLQETSTESIARQMAAAWQELLMVAVNQRPTVIVFEEAEGMDSPSLALMERLIETAQGLPVAWLLVTEPLISQPAAATVMRLGRMNGVQFTYIGLEPIDEENTLSMLYSLVDLKSLPDPLEAGIMERVGGNPLMLQHILRTLIEKRGLICDPKGRWVTTAAALSEYMPNNLRDIIQIRVRLLPDSAQQLLQLASVAGNTLFPVLLEALPDAALDTTFKLLHDADLLEESPAGLHVTVRDAVYEAIPKDQRAAIHRQIAAALVMHCELGGPWLAIRAYHMDKGLQSQGAMDAYTEAKEWAYINGALAEVAEIVGAMLDLLNERDNPELVARLLMEAQDALYQLNPEDPQCKTLLDRAYGIWNDIGNSAEAAGALLRMAVHYAGTAEEDHYYRDAQALLEREDPRHPMLPAVYLRRALYIASLGPLGNARSAEELFERARALALQLQAVDTLAQIHFEMGLYLRDHHQLTEALAAFQQALSYFSQLNMPWADESVLTCNYLADVYCHLGQPAKGEYFALEAVAGASRASNIIQPLPYVTLSECYAAQAHFPEALRAINDAPEDYASPDMPLRFWLGRWTFEGGNALIGLEIMREAVPPENVECMMWFIDYLLEGNFTEEATIRLHQMVKLGRFNEEIRSAIPIQAFYDRLRGRLAAANKDFARAISLLDRAAHQFTREGYVLLSVSTRRVYAEALLARCSPGDEQAARSLLEESIGACKKLTLHAENRRLQNVLRAHWPDATSPR